MGHILTQAWQPLHFSACSLRLFSVYGERERPDKMFPRLIRAIANGEEFPLFEGSWEHQRSFTYVGDICAAIDCVLKNWDRAEGEIFNVGTDLCFTTGEAIETVQDLRNTVSGLGIGIRVEVAASGDRLNFFNELSGGSEDISRTLPSTSIFQP